MKTAGKLICILLALFLIPLGLLFLFSATLVETEPASLETTSFFDLEAATDYRAEQLVVLEQFHFDPQTKTGYFLASIRTAEHEAVAVTFSATTDDDVWPQLLECSTDQPVILDCFVETADFYGTDDYLDPIHGIAMEALAVWTDKQIPILEDLQLAYFCADAQEANAILTGSMVLCIVVGVIALGLAAFAIWSVVKTPSPSKTVTTYAPPPRVTQQLERYQALVDAGLTTKEELEEKRREILRQ